MDALLSGNPKQHFSIAVELLDHHRYFHQYHFGLVFQSTCELCFHPVPVACFSYSIIICFMDALLFQILNYTSSSLSFTCTCSCSFLLCVAVDCWAVPYFHLNCLLIFPSPGESALCLLLMPCMDAACLPLMPWMPPAYP